MGLFDSFNPDRWGELANALQLVAYAPYECYPVSACFRRLERARGRPLNGSPNFSHWLWGQRQGVDVLLVQYETGSGSNTTSWTAAVARIDPPLWLGLQMGRETFLNRLFGGTDIQLGVKDIDEGLRIHALDPQRAAMLLAPNDGAAQTVLRYTSGLASQYSLGIQDSFVRVEKVGVCTDRAEIIDMLDPAVYVASWLGSRGLAVVPATPGQRAQQLAWQRFADAYGLRFDPYRMVLNGVVDGTLVELALELENQAYYTSISAQFHSPAPAAFRIERTTTPNFLQGIFSQDIEIGDREFDAAYKVQGNGEQQVRALFNRPVLLDALKRAASWTGDVQVGSQGLFMRVSGPSPEQAYLETLMAWARTVAAELSGQRKPVGAYR